MKMQVKEQITINASAEKVWQILAHEFDKVAEWSSGLTGSEARTGAVELEGAPVNGRVCYSDGFGGDVEEQFTYYDEAGMRFGYEGVGDLPWMFNQAENNWHVRAVDTNRSIAEFHAYMDAKWYAAILMIPFKPLIVQVWGKRTLEELKYFAENGKYSVTKDN
ncbi:MAG: SRPBCC family protein [Chloroflexota bacterium]